MSDETRSALREAFDAIEAGDLETARTVLEPVLAADPDNADAWWIYSHSVTDPQLALDALENVVRVDPEYPGATELLTTLQERLPRRPPKPAAPPPPPDDIPDLPPGEPDFELDVPPAADSELEESDEEEDEEEEEGRSFLIPLLAGGLLIVVILVLIISLFSQPQTPTVTPTTVALATLPPDSTPLVEGQSATEDAAAVTETETAAAPLVEATETDAAAAATSEASATESASVSPAATEDASSGTETETAPLVEATETDAAATSEASATESAPAATEAVVVGSAEETLLAGLRRYTLAAEPITRQDTTVGNALLVSICVNDRREVPTLLRPVMRAIATGTQALPADVQAVGARMIDCATGRAFVVMAVDRASAEGHAAGTVPYVEFRQLWQPQR